MTNASSHTAQSGTPEITIGTRITIGSYDIIVAGMASGGMGMVVWGTNQARRGETVAVKLPKPDRLDAADPQQRAAILADFEQEALTWCHLWPHPCIVAAESLLRMRGLGDLPAIFIEYAPDGSLRDLLRDVHTPGSNSAIGLEAAFVWGQMVAAALATIHQPAPELERPKPLVHCDLKPENVLLTAKGWAQLTDLGLTRALASLADAAPLSAPPLEAVGSDAGGLSAEQQAQVAQLRQLLMQAGITPQAAATTIPTPQDGALFATRTIYVSTAQQAAMAAALATMTGARAAGPGTEAAAAPPASATAMIGRMGSRGPVAGTPPYMAPEQWLGLDAVEPASDIYALGVMLFELFAGVGGRAAYPHIPDPWLLLSAGPFAAWCVAHASGPSRHLTDPEVAALSDGPLLKLRHDGQQARAEAVLAGVDALIYDCLAISPAARPTAAVVQQRLAALAEQAGLEALTIPEYPHTPEIEAAFWGNLGITYGEIGQPAEQLRLLRKSVALTPDNPQRGETLGNGLSQLGQNERIAAHKATRAGEHAKAEALMAQAQAHLEEAVRTYQAAEALMTPTWLERYPYLANGIPYNLGVTLGNLGHYDEAVVAVQRSLAAEPNSAMSYRELALIYLRWAAEAGTPATARNERLEQAEAHMRQALAIAPHFVDGRELLAIIQRELAAARRDTGRDVK